TDDIETISEHLALNIVSWYFEGKIDLMNFCGRRKELKELLDKMDESIEVYGVGGIGKTTLIHVALLIQKLRGKKIITVGTMQSYSTGSGYTQFKKKCRKSQKEIIGAVISMGDIFDALSIPVELIPKDPREKIKVISDKLISENTILFIDDFHLADDNVKELVKVSGNIVLSSKKKTGVLKNEMPIHGIDMEDRDKLIDLISNNQNKKLSDTAREKIKQIAEGVPVSTEILVKNYEKIDFDEIEDYKRNGLDLSKPEDAEEFNKRVVKEVLSENAFELLKNISVLNTDLEGNIDRKALKKTYPADFDELFNELIDTDMLDKNNEGTYQFKYRHVQEVLREDDKEKHENAIEYYKNKKQTNDNAVEVLYHRSKSSPDIKLIDLFLSLSDKLKPVHYGFRRLIEAGELLMTLFEMNDKARISGTLGILYRNLQRFEEAEKEYDEALEIYKKLAVKSPDACLPDVAMTQNNLANLYSDLKRFEEAEKAYNEALEIYKKLAVKSPDAYLPDMAMTQNNLAVLFRNLQRFEEAEKAYNEALEIRKKLVVKSPDAYLPDVAMTQNNLANLYRDLKRFEEAEKAYNEALEIYKKLAAKSPDAYLPVLLQIQVNIGIFYFYINRTEDGISALENTLKRRDLLPDFGAQCFVGLGNGYETINNTKDAAMNYMMASASYFLLFRKGIPCMDDVIEYLDKVVKLGEGEIKGDAELSITAITRLTGQERELPEGDFSKRGEALREALNGNIVEIKPENEIDLMFMLLINDIHQSSVNPTNHP
ncbi:MAG TPA: tetratricopeptide repeat protein, partial [Anaerovoracaceae bacterium]|nr:tetratricopeptide repeat protein [Anaerovoracaceae bacterium]